MADSRTEGRLPTRNGDTEEEGRGRLRLQPSMATEAQEPFMGMKVRRRSSMYRQYKGDYINVSSNQQILKILSKHGDKQVLFADRVVKVNKEGMIKQQILVITEISIYILEPKWCNLKRRIALSTVEKVCLSELNDNFFAIIVPREYDCLLASTRKSEIVTVLVEAMKKISDDSLEVVFSNSFEFYIDSENIREVKFEVVEGAVRTKVCRK
eukprot:c15267_g1_i1 orf=390-1022(-)